ncbi:intracellular multiplication protein IcmB [Oxalobacteraceae bacterium GrIS 1.11]
MSILETTVDAIEDVLAYLARYMMGRDLASYCELATAIGLTTDDVKRHPNWKDPYTLVSSDNSLLSVFDVQGCYQIISEDEFAAMIQNLRVRQNGYMRRHGHSLTFAFERDPERALDELMRLAEPQMNAARRIGLQSEDIILDRVMRNAPLVAWEQNLLVVYTHMHVMNKDEIKRELDQRAGQALEHRLPRIEHGQSPASVLMALKYRHDTMIERVKIDLERCGASGRPGVMLSQMSAHEAVKAVRIMVNRERTSQKYRPVLPGDKFTAHGREDAHDASDLAPPRLNYQICSNDVSTKGELVKTDELWHGNLSMELGPQDPLPFKCLFETVDREIAWRIRFDLHPGGLNELRARQMLVAFVGMLPSNQQIRQSFIDLTERSKEDAICSFKVTLSTWSRDETETRRRMAVLEKAVQAWGNCQSVSVHGDPLAAWASTIPAFTTRNIANRMVPPLPDALTMLPLQRPATPWGRHGNLPLRTPDGKIYPIQLGSRLQDTWIELLTGTPGSGKSALLNAMSNAAIHNAGNVRLPLMLNVEVGPSSSGTIQQLQDALPPHRKSEAAYLRLQNSAEFAVNPFDTQLGAREPTVREREFLVDFLTLLCTDPATRHAPADCARVCAMLIAIAYKSRTENGAHLYEAGVVAEVDRALDALRHTRGADWWTDATWYEVTDMLFAAGHVKEASIAQRQAVPTLPDFVAFLHDESIQHLFGEARINGNGELILGYIYRCLTVAGNSYALFNGRTRFELDSQTRVLSIDLNDVIGSQSPEGCLRTAIMYMFARQLAARNYFLRDEVLLPVIPELYRAYHLKRIADVQDEIKVMAYDETHNANGQAALIGMWIKDGREGRKWGIRILLSSQYLSDHPDALLDAATSVYVMRGGNTADEDILRQRFQVSEEAIRQLQLECRGPGPDGVNFLALFKTKVGFVVQLLTNTVGPIELWAYSTTLEDVALRTRLYQRIGPYAARRLLARHFPLGTAMEAIEQMRADSRARDDASVVERLAGKLMLAHAAQQQKKGEIL